MKIAITMARRKKLGCSLLIALCVLFAAAAGASARDAVGGFEGAGVTSGELHVLWALDYKDYTVSEKDPVLLKGTQLIKDRTYYDYQEYIFVTGEPLLLRGTLRVKKTEIPIGLETIYEYDLNDYTRGVKLTREYRFETTVRPKGGGQTVTQTVLAREPAEKIILQGKTLTLRHMDFTRTSLIDSKPSVDYYSGNNWYKKYYEAGGGAATSASGDYVVVEATSIFYGFDQAWGNADFEDTEYVIRYTQSAAAAASAAAGGGAGEGANPGEGRELWSGSANIRRSQTTETRLRYIDNEPDAISFRGGFLETRQNINWLEYSAMLPEFGADGAATGRIKTYNDSSQIFSFPQNKRLVSPGPRQAAGHWAEESIAKLFGLEILKARPQDYIPDQYVTRAEFAAALVAAAPPVPPDRSLKAKNKPKPRVSGKKGQAASFTDVGADHVYYAQIEEALARGMMGAADKKEFRPDDKISVADASVALVRALGLEAAASAHGAVTEFADDGDIPAYARDALYALQKIGLLRGDQSGAANPKKDLTKAEAAVILDRLVEYMRTDLQFDYREHLLDY